MENRARQVPYFYSFQPRSRYFKNPEWTTELQQYIHDNDWDNVFDLLANDYTSRKGEAKKVDHNGDTPLLQACKAGAPLDVIEALVEKYHWGLYRTNDKWGYLPLHVAVLLRASLNVIQFLTRMDTTGQALLVVDCQGATPLSYATPEQLPAFLELPHVQAIYSVSGHPNKNSSFRATLLHESIAKFASLGGHYYEKNHGERISRETVDDSLDVVTVHGHHLAMIQSIIRLHPKQVMEQDSRGNLPLHLVASTYSSFEPHTCLLYTSPSPRD